MQESQSADHHRASVSPPLLLLQLRLLHTSHRPLTVVCRLHSVLLVVEAHHLVVCQQQYHG